MHGPCTARACTSRSWKEEEGAPGVGGFLLPAVGAVVVFIALALVPSGGERLQPYVPEDATLCTRGATLWAQVAYLDNTALFYLLGNVELIGTQSVQLESPEQIRARYTASEAAE